MAFSLNCTLTVRDWQFAARRDGGKTWEYAARKWAEKHGAAVVLMGNDDVVVFSREGDKLVKRKGLLY